MTLSVGAMPISVSSFQSQLQSLINTAMSIPGGANSQQGLTSSIQSTASMLSSIGQQSSTTENLLNSMNGSSSSASQSQTGSYAEQFGNMALGYMSSQSLFSQNQMSAVGSLTQDAQQLHASVQKLQDALNPNMTDAINATSVGAAVQTFVSAFNMYQGDLTTANSDGYITNSVSSDLASTWDNSFSSGAGLGITQNSDGTLSFSQNALNQSMASGTDPSSNAGLQQALSYVSAVDNVATTSSFQSISNQSADNPYSSGQFQISSAANAYLEMSQWQMNQALVGQMFNMPA